MQFAATTDGQLSLMVRQRTYKQLQAILCAFILYTHDILRRNTVYHCYLRDKIKIKNQTVVGIHTEKNTDRLLELISRFAHLRTDLM